MGQGNEPQLQANRHPHRGQEPLERGGQNHRSCRAHGAMSLIQVPPHACRDGHQEHHLDGDACCKSVEGPHVGVAQLGQGTERHSGEQHLNEGRRFVELGPQEQPGDALGLPHQGRRERQGGQRNQVHAAKHDLLHFGHVVLKAGQAAEQDAVPEFAQHGDGLPHQVDGPVVHACRPRAQSFAHQPQVHLGGGVGQQVEGGASGAVAEQGAERLRLTSSGDGDAGEPNVAGAEHQVLDQQGRHVGPNAGAGKRQAQAHDQIAQHHACQRALGQGLEIHLADQQAAGHHAES